MAINFRKGPEIPVCDVRTIGRLVEKAANQYGDRIFLTFENETYSYRSIHELSGDIAEGFQEIGVVKGDRVAVFLPNCPDFILTWFGIMKIGAIEVPINTEQKGELLSYLLNNCGAKVIVTTAELFVKVQEVADQLSHLVHVVLPDQASAANSRDRNGGRFQLHALESFKQTKGSVQKTSVSPANPFCFMYTSGTTGNSKGVILPHNYAMYAADSIKHIIGFDESDVVYVCMPLFHGNAQMLAILPAMVAGGSVVLEAKFSASRFWDQIRKYKVTVANLVGSIVAILHKAEPSELDRSHTLRAIFTAATPKQLFTEFESRFGVQIFEGFGSTECGMVLMNRKNDRKIGSIGKPAPGYDVQIFDETDHPLQPGEIGEIVTRPIYPFIMMQGYYNMPGETLEAYRNLWFHTGDLGYYDEDGFFYFVDRKKDAIRRRGENISSAEVELIINMHPEVIETAAIGVPSELGEEEVKIVVVRKLNSSLSYEQLHLYCREKMAKYMVPRYMEWANELPKSATQRIQKYKLKQAGETALTWDSERGR